MSESISPDTTLYASDTTPSNSPTATPPHHPLPPISPSPNSASLERQIQEVEDTSCSEGSVTQNLGKRKREEEEPYFTPQRYDMETECRIAYGDYCNCGNDAAHEAWMAVVHYDDRWVHLEKVKRRILRKMKWYEDLFHAHLRGPAEEAGEDQAGDEEAREEEASEGDEDAGDDED